MPPREVRWSDSYIYHLESQFAARDEVVPCLDATLTSVRAYLQLEIERYLLPHCFSILTLPLEQCFEQTESLGPLQITWRAEEFDDSQLSALGADYDS